MTPIFYLLLPLVLFTILLYPLLRKAVSLLEILVNKYIRQTNTPAQPSATTRTDTAQTLLNLKLLAYERIILFIERMKPDSLIPRTLTPSLSGKEYQLSLINEIRREFEYNLSQQLYLSENAWTVTVNYKDSIITLINSASADCSPSDTAAVLARKILEQYISSDIKTDRTLQIIKSDLQ